MFEKKILNGFEGLRKDTTAAVCVLFAVVSVRFAVVSLHSPQNPLNFRFENQQHSLRRTKTTFELLHFKPCGLVQIFDNIKNQTKNGQTKLMN